MSQSIPVLTLTVNAAAALTKYRFVGGDGNPAAAAGNALGVNVADASVGDYVAVNVLGTTIVEAGGAIAANAAVEIDASARAVTLNTGVKVGRLAPGSSAGAAGDLVEVILIPN